jgi:flagellar basal-body rod protein FlgC
LTLFGIHISVWDASVRRLTVSANNVANSLTPGFKAQRLDQAALGTGGVAIVGTTIDGSQGPLIPDETSNSDELVEGSNTDLARETVEQITDLRAFQANTKVLKANDEMLGQIIDLRG